MVRCLCLSACQDLDLFRGGVEDARDESGHAIPLVGFGAELAATGGGEAVETGFAVVVGFAPLAGDEALVFEAVERGVERALLDGKLFAGDLLDAEQDAIAVERAKGDRFEDEHVEGALHEVELVGHGVLLDDLGGR